MTQSKLADLVEKAKTYIREHNTSKAPYHSNRHMLEMCGIATTLYTNSSEREYETSQELYHLQLACLFHDFGHTGGHLTDRENITIATEVFRQWAKAENIYQGDIERIVQMIEITEYPFKENPLTFAESCIRDADVLYPTLSEDPRIIMEHLRAEIEVSSSCPVSHQAMLDGQFAFSENIVLFTKLGQKFWDQAMPPYMATLKDYVRYAQSDCDVNYDCFCYKEEQIKAEDIRTLWWHQAVIEYTTREYRTPHPLSVGLPSDANLGPDLEWLTYLKRVQTYLGPDRVNAYPATIEKLDALYREAEAAFNEYPYANETRSPRRFKQVHGSCVYRFRELKDKIRYMDRPRYWA